MKSVLAFLALALTFVSCVFGSRLSELAALEQDIKQLYAQWDSLTEKQQKAVETLEKYYEFKSSFFEEQKRNIERKRTQQRDEVAPGVYVDVELDNQDKYSVRQTSRIDFEEVITSLFQQYCIIPLCGNAIANLIEDFLPDLVMIQSLQGEAVNATEGNFDLMVHFLAFPGSVELINQILYNTFGLSIYPTTSVSYFTAQAKFTSSFTSASLDFKAQAFSILQTFTSLIEYSDTNGNKAYDVGEEVKTVNLGSTAWNPTTYRSFNVGNTVVHEIITSTKDNVVRFFCDTSSFPLKDADGQVIQPNATKCSINIRDFAFSQNNTYLSLKANVALVGGKISGQAEGVLSITPSTSGTTGGFFSWVENVDVNGKQFSVSASASALAKSEIVDLGAVLTTLANGDYEVDARELIFNFQTNPNPSFIVWDPTVAYGEVPVAKDTNSSAYITFSMIFVTLFAIFAIFF